MIVICKYKIYAIRSIAAVAPGAITANYYTKDETSVSSTRPYRPTLPLY